MTLGSLRSWLASLEAAGVSPDEEILVDALSESEGASFRCRLTGASLEHAHDEDDTPFGVLTAEDIDDEESTQPEGAADE